MSSQVRRSSVIACIVESSKMQFFQQYLCRRLLVRVSSEIARAEEHPAI